MKGHDHRTRVLLVAEDRIDAEDIAVLLSPEMRCDVSQDPLAALGALENGAYDLILLDTGLGGGDGARAVLHRVRDLTNAVPVILLSSSGESQIVADGLRFGAFHYVLMDSQVLIRDLIHVGRRAIEGRAG